jgi:hypothetical protein
MYMSKEKQLEPESEILSFGRIKWRLIGKLNIPGIIAIWSDINKL